ncbi:MAG: hypothetical protein V2I97_12920 [Desulfococcaceae bacterium]|jgi:hypothetical protein|nr:hypothetical protein [Desulfococcaceae bacterium]
MSLLQIKYRFTLPNALLEEFNVVFDPHSLVYTGEEPANPPHWAKISFHSCSSCPYSEKEEPYCSVAVNLTDIVRRFAHLTSYDEVFVEVISPERIYYKKTSAQRGISSLMGLMIAVSKCPFTDFFKPMARFHLPFATAEETVWRAASTYLISQYFRKKQGGESDSDLEGLNRIYSNIQKMNVSIARRIRAACAEDSTVNAIIILDIFAKSMPTVIEQSLEKLRPFFNPLLRCPPRD